MDFRYWASIIWFVMSYQAACCIRWGRKVLSFSELDRARCHWQLRGSTYSDVKLPSTSTVQSRNSRHQIHSFGPIRKQCYLYIYNWSHRYWKRLWRRILWHVLSQLGCLCEVTTAKTNHWCLLSLFFYSYQLHHADCRSWKSFACEQLWK